MDQWASAVVFSAWVLRRRRRCCDVSSCRRQSSARSCRRRTGFDRFRDSERKMCLKLKSEKLVQRIRIQRKPLNVITLGPSKSDNINRMITMTDLLYSYLL